MADHLDGSDDELLVLEEAKPQSRTMLHYFKTGGTSNKSKTPKSAPVVTEGDADKKRKKQNSPVVSDVEPTLPRKKKKKVEKEEVTEELNVPEKIEAQSRKKKKDEVSEATVPENTETVAPQKKPISCFFKKVSKTDFHKEFERQIAAERLTVKALVHIPTKSAGPSNTERSASKMNGSERRCSNVSRNAEETDVIVVIKEKEVKDEEKVEKIVTETVVEEKKVEEECDKEKGGEVKKQDVKEMSKEQKSDDVAKQRSSVKISNTLFKKRTEKDPTKTKNKSAPHYDSDSVDLEFLDTLTRRTFAPPGIDSSDSSPEDSPFAALVKKPLVHTTSFANTIEKVSPTGNKENLILEPDLTATPKIIPEGSNAFARLMARKKLNDEIDATDGKVEVLAPTENDTEPLSNRRRKRKNRAPLMDPSDEESNPSGSGAKRKRGRPRKKTVELDSSAMDFVDEPEKAEKLDSSAMDFVDCAEKSPVKSAVETATKQNTVTGCEKQDCPKNAFTKMMSKDILEEQSQENCREDETNQESAPIVSNESQKVNEETEGSSQTFSQNEISKLNDSIITEEEATSAEESGSNSTRRSSRIKRNQIYEKEKRKEQEEINRLLDEKIREEDGRKRGRRSKVMEKKEEEIIDVNEVDGDEICVEKVVITSKKKQQKLAPIFIGGKKANPLKVIEDPEKVAARKAFLLSSAPDILRNQMIETSKDDEEPLLHSSFSEIGHIMQRTEGETLWNLKEVDLHLRPDVATDHSTVVKEDLCPGQLSSSCGETPPQKLDIGEIIRLSKHQIHGHVKTVKGSEQRFPVNKVFRRFLERRLESDALEAEARNKNVSLDEIEEERLRSGRRILRRRRKSGTAVKAIPKQGQEVKFDPSRQSCMQWTMKYAPKCSDDVIGNQLVVRKLKGWLNEWIERESKQNEARGSQDSSSGSDFSGGGFSDSDDSSSLPNTALLIGPNGVGKTASVYALAHELGFKVLEVNASSLRGGRQVWAQLHEATQSHHVAKQEHKKNGIFKAVKTKKSKEGAKETKINRTALILFEDIDVVFEDMDDGFYTAVNSLIASTKRPIVLTTSNPHFPETAGRSLKKEAFAHCYRFKATDPRLTAQYLQLLCLTEGFPIDLDSIAQLVARNNRMVSRSILELQYWTMSAAAKYSRGDSVDGCDENDSFMTTKRRRGAIVISDSEEDPSVTDEENDRDCDHLAKLLGVEKKKMQKSEGVREMTLDLMGNEKFSSSLVERLHSLGLADVVEDNRHRMFLGDLPRRRRFNKYPLPEAITGDGTKSTTFNRIKPLLNSSIFSTESSDEDDETTAKEKNESCQISVSEPISNAAKKVLTPEERESNRKTLALLSESADFASAFLSVPDPPSWWRSLSFSSRLDEVPPVGQDVAAFLHHSTLMKCMEALPCGESNNMDVAIDTDPYYDRIRTCDRDTLNRIVSDLTVAPTPLVVDLLPAVRSMARSEEERRAGVGGKRSRSGRFLHHFEAQDAHLPQRLLNTLCNSFLGHEQSSE